MVLAIGMVLPPLAARADRRADRPMTASTDAPPSLGVSWPTWSKDGYANPQQHIDRMSKAGFRLVCLVPTYTYAGRQDIDFTHAPSFASQGEALELLLKQGFHVVYKPHLDPPRYQPGFDALHGDYDSWRAMCPWRGYFDVDPLSDDYAKGIIEPALDMIAAVLARLPNRQLPAIRFDLGSELMNSIVYSPQRWRRLLQRTRRAIAKRRLQGRVLLSHDFSHHFAIPDDEVERMSRPARAELARYIRSLDAIALSQYLDLTIAVPSAERRQRLPTADEVAAALRHHEDFLVREVLVRRLGLRERQVPALHFDEFGIGSGGLRHPNLWEGEPNDKTWPQLERQIALGHAGLVAFLRGPRRTRSAILWVTGFYFDVFGWQKARNAIPAAAATLQSFLRP